MGKQVKKVAWRGCICGKVGILMDDEVHADDDPARCALALFATVHGYQMDRKPNERIMDILQAYREKFDELFERVRALERKLGVS